MRRSCCSQSRRASPARDECVAAHGIGQRNQQWRIRQLINSCIDIIKLSRIPVLIIFALNLQAINITRVLSNGGERLFLGKNNFSTTSTTFVANNKLPTCGKIKYQVSIYIVRYYEYISKELRYVS